MLSLLCYSLNALYASNHFENTDPLYKSFHMLPFHTTAMTWVQHSYWKSNGAYVVPTQGRVSRLTEKAIMLQTLICKGIHIFIVTEHVYSCCVCDAPFITTIVVCIIIFRCSEHWEALQLLVTSHFGDLAKRKNFNQKKSYGNDELGEFPFCEWLFFSFNLFSSLFFVFGTNSDDHSFVSTLLQPNVRDTTIYYFIGSAHNMVPYYCHLGLTCSTGPNVNEGALTQGYWFHNSGACQ